jgi:hypothetical protein
MSLGCGCMLSSREGHQIAAIGLSITMKTSGKSTHDAYSLFEYAIPARTDGPPPHIHMREDESFICLTGKLNVYLGGDHWRRGRPVLAARHRVHVRNVSDEESRVISVVSPAGLEDHYQALAEHAGRARGHRQDQADHGRLRPRAASAARGDLTMPVAIIGAGVAGLTTAKLLRQAGHKVAVCDKAPDSLSDFPMPRAYPEWRPGPGAAPVHRGHGGCSGSGRRLDGHRRRRGRSRRCARGGQWGVLRARHAALSGRGGVRRGRRTDSARHRAA